MAALGLHFCVRAFSSCGKWGPLFIAVCGLLTIAALSLSRPLLLRSTGSRRAGSVIVAHGPSCSAARGIFPGQGSNLSPALAGRFSTTAPPGKPYSCVLRILYIFWVQFLCQICGLQIFFPNLWLAFHSLSAFQRAKVLILTKTNTSFFSYR